MVFIVYTNVVLHLSYCKPTLLLQLFYLFNYCMKMSKTSTQETNETSGKHTLYINTQYSMSSFYRHLTFLLIPINKRVPCTSFFFTSRIRLFYEFSLSALAVCPNPTHPQKLVLILFYIHKNTLYYTHTFIKKQKNNKHMPYKMAETSSHFQTLHTHSLCPS